MNENIDLTKILKDVPEGTKLWSSVYGCVHFLYVDPDVKLSYHPDSPIVCKEGYFTKDGKLYPNFHYSECILYPSRTNHDWSKFEAPKKHKEFKPFEKVLVKERYGDCRKTVWMAAVYSHYDKDTDKHYCAGAYGFLDDEILPYVGNEDMLGKKFETKD